MSSYGNLKTCEFCSNSTFTNVFTYNSPPKLETKFSSTKTEDYKRAIIKCNTCGHFYSKHNMDLSSLYQGEYNQSTYKDEEGMEKTFDRIINLDPNKSDNQGRCNRIEKFILEHYPNKQHSEFEVLDIGSGLGVFPWTMSKRGFKVTALDPDSTAIEHIKKTTKLPVILGDFLKINISNSFDIISLNKVLEHVENPIEMLKRSSTILKQGGIIYVEVPDGEVASFKGEDREEFVIDHLHAFSFNSLSLMASKSGLQCIEVERLEEPSTKYTIRAFIKPNPRET